MQLTLKSHDGSERSVGVLELTSREAVLRALAECAELGAEKFLARHKYGKSLRYYLVHDGVRYDAKAIAGVAYGYQFPERPRKTRDHFNGGVADTNRALEDMGFFVMDGRPKSVDDERVWRLSVWSQLQATVDLDAVEPRILRAYGAFGGAQGVWVDADRTKLLDSTAPTGITVGALHTGSHYADDLTDDGVIYHYPSTGRPGSRDQSEIEATKAAGRLKVPLFLIAYPWRRAPVRRVRLAWVEGWDDAAGSFLVTFGNEAPAEVLTEDHSDDVPFALEGNRSQRTQRDVRIRPDQRKFKFQVLQRYGICCPLSGVSVPEMLDAAHLRPDADNGSSDPRNGLPLNAALHRAFDAHLFAIDPDTFEVALRPQGPSLLELGITQPHIGHLTKKPHTEALRWRFDLWRSRLRQDPNS